MIEPLTKIEINAPKQQGERSMVSMMRYYARLLAMVLLALVSTGCNEPTTVSGTQFTAMLRRDPESMRTTQFIGIRGDGMAILKVSEMSSVNKRKWTETYFITAITNLPADFPYPLPVPPVLHDKNR